MPSVVVRPQQAPKPQQQMPRRAHDHQAIPTREAAVEDEVLPREPCHLFRMFMACAGVRMLVSPSTTRRRVCCCPQSGTVLELHEVNVPFYEFVFFDLHPQLFFLLRRRTPLCQNGCAGGRTES